MTRRPRVLPIGGTGRKRVLAAFAIAALTITNLGAGALAAPAANAQEFSAAGDVSVGLSQAQPTVTPVVDEDSGRWRSYLLSYVNNGQNNLYSWLTSPTSVTQSNNGINPPTSGPEYTGPVLGDVGPIMQVGSDRCIEGTTTPYPSSSVTSTAVKLAACDELNPRQQWKSRVTQGTPFGRFLAFESMDSDIKGHLTIGLSAGISLYTPEFGGILDPVEQSAELVITSPENGAVYPAGTLVPVSGTGRPGAKVDIRYKDGPSIGSATVDPVTLKWSLTAPVAFPSGENILEGSMTGKKAETKFTMGEVAPDLAHSTIGVSHPSRIADGVSASTVTVTLKDANGDQLTKGGDGDSVEILTNLGTLSTPIVDNNDGTYSADLTSSVVGEAVVGFKLDGVESAETATVDFVADDVDVDATSATDYWVSGNTTPVVTGYHTVTVKAADKNGHPVVLTDPATQIVASYSPETTPAGRVSFSEFEPTGTVGVYEARVRSEVADTFTIGVKINNLSVTAKDASKKTASFVAGPADLLNGDSGFTLTDQSRPVVSGTHQVTVVLVDGQGNPVSLSAADLVKLKWAATVGGGMIDSPFTAVSGTPGTYVANIKSTEAGKKTIAVTLDGVTVNALAGNEVWFHADTPSTSVPGTNYEVTGGSRMVGTEEFHTVTMNVVDANGNKLPSLTKDSFVFTADPSASVTFGDFVKVSDGVYTVQVFSKSAGPKKITVGLTAGGTLSPAKEGGADVNTSALFKAAGVSEQNNAYTNFTVTDTPVAVGNSHTVTVKLADEYGNPVSDAAALLGLPQVSGGLGAGVVPSGFVEGTTPGTYTATVTSKLIGSKIVSVNLPGGKSVLKATDGNDTAVFTAGAVSAEFSTLTVSAGPIHANGEDAATAVVTLKDAFGNLITDVPAGTVVTVTAAPLSATPSVTVPGTTTGTFTADITSETAGEVTVSFTVNGDQADAAEKVMFVTVAVPEVDYANGFSVAGKAVKGQTIVVRNSSGGTVGTIVVTNDDGSFLVPITGVIHGEVLDVSAIDSNRFESDSAPVTVDANRPGKPTVDPSNGDEIKGTTKPGSEVVVKDDHDNILCETTADGSGKFSCVPTPKPNDEDEVFVEVVDPSGNPGEEPGSVIIDQKRPKKPAVDPSNGDEIKGTTKPGSEVVVKDKDYNILCETTADPATGKFSCVPAPKPNDEDEVFVEVVDPSGNTGEEPGSVVIDQKKPGKPAVDPSNGDEIKGTTKPGSEVVVKDKDDNILCETTADPETGKFSCVPAPKPNDEDEVFVEVVDPSGNTGEEPGSVVIDQKKPGKPAVDPSNGDEIKGTTKPGSEVVVKDKDDNILCETTADPETGKFSCVPTPKPNDEDEVFVEVVDPSGNPGEEPGSVIIDQKRPKKPEVDPSNGNEIKGTTKPGSEVVVKGENGDVICETTADDKGKFSCVPSPKPVDGDTVTVEVTDPAGNKGEEPGSVVIDTVPPNAPVVNPSNGSEISGTGEAGAKAVVKGPDGTVLCETMVNAKGQFMCVPQPKPKHGDKITVTLTDPSGNESEPGSVVINTVPPTAPIVDVSNGKKVTGGIIKSGNTVTVVDNDGKKIPGIIGIDSAGRFTFTPTTPLTEKDKVFVVVTDPEGNSTKVPVRIKTSKPAKPVVKPSEGGSVSGCAEPGSTVTVRDENGNVIGTATAGDDCKFTVTLDPKQSEGKTITIEVTDEAGNVSDSVSVRVGLISIVLKNPELQAGDTQTAYGYGFQPGEKVSGVLRSTPVDLGTQVADADGSVTFTFTLAGDIELGEHTVTLSGGFSGSVKDTFKVVKTETVASPGLPVTGSDLILPLSGAVLLLLTGLGLVAVKRRQRESSTL